MRPLHEIAVLILMATALSSKRRPASLVDIVAAADMIQGSLPFPEKLGDAIRQLSSCGLIAAAEGGFTLTPAAQEIMAGQPKRGDSEALVSALAGSLAAYSPKQEYPAIIPSEEQLKTAIQAHKASRRAPGKNLLMPKPKPDRHFKVDGRWRRASPKH
jgi:hypothetical protein